MLAKRSPFKPPKMKPPTISIASEKTFILEILVPTKMASRYRVRIIPTNIRTCTSFGSFTIGFSTKTKPELNLTAIIIPAIILIYDKMLFIRPFFKPNTAGRSIRMDIMISSAFNHLPKTAFNNLLNNFTVKFSF